jgi:hypothetical protein
MDPLTYNSKKIVILEGCHRSRLAPQPLCLAAVLSFRECLSLASGDRHFTRMTNVIRAKTQQLQLPAKQGSYATACASQSVDSCPGRPMPSSADGPYNAGTVASFKRRYTVNCPR